MSHEEPCKPRTLTECTVYISILRSSTVWRGLFEGDVADPAELARTAKAETGGPKSGRLLQCAAHSNTNTSTTLTSLHATPHAPRTALHARTTRPTPTATRILHLLALAKVEVSYVWWHMKMNGNCISPFARQSEKSGSAAISGVAYPLLQWISNWEWSNQPDPACNIEPNLALTPHVKCCDGWLGQRHTAARSTELLPDHWQHWF